MKTKNVPGGMWASFPVLLISTFLTFAGLQRACAGPEVVTQPTNQTVTAGGAAIFSVTAAGVAPLSYQWYFNNAGIFGATNSILTLNNVQPGEAGAYYAAVANAYGSTNSVTATLTVNATFPPEAPYIITEPTNQTVATGNATGFSVIAVGGAPLSYQWYLNGTNLWGATNATLTLGDVSEADAGAYYLTVTDTYGAATSTTVTLTINSSSPTGSPYIITQPTDQTVTAGDAGTFSVTAGGAAPLSYDWIFNGTNLVGTNATLTLNDANPADAGVYQVFIENAYGSTNSVPVTLTVNSSGPSQAPYIVTQPTNQTVTAGGTAIFSVTAGGAAPLSYDWIFNGTNSVGTNATLVLDDVTPADGGAYHVFIVNAYGSTNSDPATLTVSSSSSCDPVPSGIVSWWPGEGNANDVIGTNNGILENGVTFTEGVVGEAFHFNGSNQDVQIPYSTSLEPANITVECWVKLDALASPVAAYPGLQYIVFKQNSRGGDFEGYDLEKNRINGQDVFRFQVTSVDGEQVPAASTTIPQPGVWYHLAGTYDGTNVNIYVNGVLEGTAVAGFPMDYGTEPVYFGTTGQGFDGRLEGALDEVSIYNRVLSSSEIAAIYQAGSDGKCPPNSSMAPYIITQPANQTVSEGGTATFSVTAGGAAPLSYAWYFHGTNLLVGTNATLVLDDVNSADAGVYQVFIENAYGSTDSVPVTLTVTSSSCDPVPSGIVAWWPAEGNADDIINGNDGVVTNGTVGYAPAEVGLGFSFDGGPNRLIVPDSPSLDIGSNVDFTVETWIRAFPTNTPQGVMSICDKRYAPNNIQCQGYEVSLFNGQLNLRISDNPSGNGNSWSAGPNLLDGQLHHVAVSVARDSTTGGNLYVDGVNVLQFDPTSVEGDLTTSEPLRIGNHPDPTYISFFDGQIDELSIYKRALSSSEIAAIYQAGSAGKCPPITRMAPYIIEQPSNQTVSEGGTATFSVTAGGTVPLNYDWYFNGTNLVGTNSTLTLENASPADAGVYQVFVSNAYGSTNSLPVTLTINSTGPTSNIPVITSFSPTSGATGTVVNISGLNFSPAASNNIVYFGAVRATVQAASSTALQVTMPAGATYAPITETVNGLTAYANASFVPTFYGSAPTNFSLGQQLVFNASNGPSGVVIADFDGDGKPDLAVNNGGSHTIEIYRNISANGTLTTSSFAPPVVLPIGTGGQNVMVAADLTGDGRLDLICLDLDSNLVMVIKNLSTPGSLTSGSFAAPINFAVGTGPRGVAVRDLDQDGKPEIVTANWQDSTVSVLRNLSTPGNITPNSFAPAVAFPTGTNPQNVMIADIDGDGQPDLVTVNNNYSGSTSGMSVLRNVSTPTNIVFASHVDFPGLQDTYCLAIGDLDGDGKPDVVIGSQPGGQSISVYRNTSTPGAITTSSFAPEVDFAAGGWVNSVALGDLNGDGKLDIAAALQLPSQMDVFLNTSTRGSISNNSFAAPLVFASGYNAIGIAIGDLNGDGIPDFAFANNYDNTFSIYQNMTGLGGETNGTTPTLDHFTWNLIPSPQSRNTPIMLTITARDAANNIVTNFAGTVSISSTNGIPVRPATSGNFVQGAWTGLAEVPAPATNLVLIAADESGHIGLSNPFNVINPPLLISAPFGNRLQIGWPASASGFVLEMTTNLGSGNWIPVPGQPLQLSNLCLQPMAPAMTNSQAFYRLHYMGQ